MKSSVRIRGYQQQACHGICLVLLVIVFAVAGAGYSGSGFAQSGSPQDQEEVGPVNQEQALERVRARFPGNVISINEVRQDGRVRFRIRLDNDGNIYTVYVDRATGAVTRE